MKNKFNKLILILIVLLGGIIRFYKLGSIETGFFRDEAALGFNSWSILKTGADEFGRFFPLIFRSFEVFFMPAYTYLSVPFFAFFGQSEFSARALSALSGTLLIFISYLISKELFKSEKAGWLTALIVSIAPWSIFYSRGAFEGNLGLFFFSLGFYLWIKFLGKGNKKIFFLSLLFFVLSMYSYQASRFIAPIFVFFSILFKSNWLKNIKLWIFGGLFTLLLYFPVLLLTFSPAGYHRVVGVSIFSRSFQPSGSGKELLSLYFHYFSPSNLFWQGDYNPQRRVPNYSVFYLWMLPLCLLGIKKVCQTNYKAKKELFLWLLLSPVPAALTRDPFHTYRSILFFLPISLLIGLGFSQFVGNLGKHKIILSGVSFVIIFSLSSFLFNLFKVAPTVFWRDWDYGYREVCNVIKKQPSDLRIVIDDPNTESYIHFLFHNLIPIGEYQKAASLMVSDGYYKSADELRPAKIGRFEFRKVDWLTERGDKNTIFVFPSNRLYPSEFSGDPKLTLIKTVYSPSGEPAFYLVKSAN